MANYRRPTPRKYKRNGILTFIRNSEGTMTFNRRPDKVNDSPVYTISGSSGSARSYDWGTSVSSSSLGTLSTIFTSYASDTITLSEPVFRTSGRVYEARVTRSSDSVETIEEAVTAEPAPMARDDYEEIQ